MVSCIEEPLRPVTDDRARILRLTERVLSSG